MNCKHCGKELEENATVCPACGETVETAASVEETAPAKEKKQKKDKKIKKDKKPMGKGPKIIIAVSLAVVLLLGLAVGVVYAFGFSFDFNKWENTIDVKNRYTAPELLAKASADTVVATLGDRELTNGVLQMYYARQLWDLVEEYGNYLSNLGLDLTRPLSEQTFPYEEGLTWEQYLLNGAIDAWRQQQTLVLMAEAEEFQYPEGLQEFLDALGESLDTQATQNGYKDGDALVKKEMGASANVERYRAYSEIYNKSLEFYAHLFESMEPDESQVSKYFDEHAEELESQYGVTKEKNPVIDVRHILLIPKVSTDESKAVCLQRAEELLEQWKTGAATEESFAQLANEHSEDPGSNTNGGLYEYVYQGDMVDTFDAWCFDESRKPGDTGIVETDYGYHIMYFVYGADEWYRTAYQSMCGEMCQQMIASASNQYGFQKYYWKVALSAVDFE